MAGVVAGAVVVLVGGAVASCGSPHVPDVDVPWATSTVAPVWADEFTGAPGAAPDPARWTHETGGHWSAEELECYTDSTRNAALDGKGHLVITARREPSAGCPDGAATGYTSARLTSTFRAAAGTLAIRAALPSAAGVWPALWALGSTYPQTGWPGCGEMDLAEGDGRDGATLGVHLHGPGFSGASSLGRRYGLTAPVSRFHVYSVSWTSTSVQFYVDGEGVWGVTERDLPRGASWPDPGEYFAILNVAVGGLAGPPPPETTWPQTLVVDYVRFYAGP